MKSIILWCVIFLSLTHSTVAQSSELTIGKTLSIKSTILEEQREVFIYIPESYHTSNTKYPVLYTTDAESQFAHTVGTVQFLAQQHKMPEVIVVSVKNTNRNRDLRPTLAKEGSDVSKSEQQKFLRFYLEELAPEIDKLYRTIPYKVLSGISYGGLFTLNTLLTKPDAFNAYIALSPSLWWDDKILLKKAQSVFSTHKAKGKLFMSLGNEVDMMSQPFHQFIKIMDNYPSKYFSYSFKLFNDETHNSVALISFYHGLKHTFKNWDIPDTPQNLTQLLKRYKSMSEQLNTVITLPEDKANGYAQWLTHLNRKRESLELLRWNKHTYPHSKSALTNFESALKEYKDQE